jgi:hypothetical protein
MTSSFFQYINPPTGLLSKRFAGNNHPYTLSTWGFDGLTLANNPDGVGCFGFVRKGPAELKFSRGPLEGRAYVLDTGMWFTVPTKAFSGGAGSLFALQGGDGILIETHDDEEEEKKKVAAALDTENKKLAASDESTKFKVTPPLFALGGPCESSGRLRYINGCSDTLLASPVIRGQACMNHLHFPPNTDQSFHTHPLWRVGVVLRGEGECLVQHPHPNSRQKGGDNNGFTTDRAAAAAMSSEKTAAPFTALGTTTASSSSSSSRQQTAQELAESVTESVAQTPPPSMALPIPLKPGTVFEIPPGSLRAFRTSSAACLDVAAWHPDSDIGPTDDDHPMINRTFVEMVDNGPVS